MLQIKNNTARLIVARDQKLGKLHLLPGHHLNNVDDDSWKDCYWIKILKKNKDITVKQVKEESDIDTNFKGGNDNSDGADDK